MQLDPPVRIRVRRREQFVSDGSLDAELLANLPHQAGGMRLAGLALAARKFPVALEMDALLAACQQKAIVALDDRGGDDDRDHGLSGLKGNARQLFAIGHTRHFGFRATQTIAPKSISAWLKSKTCRTGTSVSDTRHR